MNTLKQYIHPLLAITVAPLLLCACGDEEEAPVQFQTLSNSNPDNITVEYYSPDPSCVGKMYYITTNFEAGDLVWQCTNYDNIYIGDNLTTYQDTLCAYTVTIDGTLLNLHFDAIPDYDDNTFHFGGLSVRALHKGKEVSSWVGVYRWRSFTIAHIPSSH